MLIPLTRVPGIIARTFVEGLAPSLATQCAHLPARRSHPIPGLPQIFGLYGMRNTRDVVGPTVLRYVISRDFSSNATTTLSTDQAGAASTSEVEPDSGSDDLSITEKLIAQRDMSYTLTQRGERYILSVLCGNSMYYELHIPLTSEEISKALADTAFLDDFSGKVQYSPSKYLPRSITPP